MKKALEKISIDLLNSLEYGQEVKISDKFTLYKYSEEDIVVIILTDKWEEIIQLLWDDFNVTFEVLNTELYENLLEPVI